MKKLYFASDLHLGAPCIADRRAHERRIVGWLESISADARALYLLGDVFDYWFEYRTVIPRGFVRFQAKVAEMADSGIDVHFFTGNHDAWMSDYLASELGVSIHTRPLRIEDSGRRFLLGHGDDLGYDRLYHAMLWCFHNRFLQACYRWVHPDLAGLLAKTWSRRSRKGHDADDRKRGGVPIDLDREWQVDYARRRAAAGDEADFYVFGHRHEVIDCVVGDRGQRLLVIGDWIRNFSYAVFDGRDMKIERYGGQ